MCRGTIHAHDHNHFHTHSHVHTHDHDDWEKPDFRGGRALRVGVGGPVGSGKTALLERICELMYPDYSIGVITNDIYTKEDAAILTKTGVLPGERIIGVETGGCPHTAVREDVSMNVEAIEELERRYNDLELVFIESGGDNLAAAFSPELVDLFVYIIDVAQGEKIPRKGGPGIIRSDLLVINKTDLAPHVGTSLEVMERDSRRMREERPFVMTNLRKEKGAREVVEWLLKTCPELQQRKRDA